MRSVGYHWRVKPTGRIAVSYGHVWYLCKIKDGEFICLISCSALPKRIVLGCLEKSKMTVYHLVSAIGPYRLKRLLESNLDLSPNDLKRCFEHFINHCVDLATAFQMVDLGSSTSKKASAKTTERNNHFPQRPRRTKNTKYRRYKTFVWLQWHGSNPTVILKV